MSQNWLSAVWIGGSHYSHQGVSLLYLYSIPSSCSAYGLKALHTPHPTLCCSARSHSEPEGWFWSLWERQLLCLCVLRQERGSLAPGEGVPLPAPAQPCSHPCRGASGCWAHWVTLACHLHSSAVPAAASQPAFSTQQDKYLRTKRVKSKHLIQHSNAI